MDHPDLDVLFQILLLLHLLLLPLLLLLLLLHLQADHCLVLL